MYVLLYSLLAPSFFFLTQDAIEAQELKSLLTELRFSIVH